ncbi:Polyhydroxyalkanoic acid synthase [Legionella pneumophila subsp. pneumophila LPE509]|nr:Polyhydroxyalkanoic acid synthase [Legionella pneumophila subsp. pneumophila LPE509]
MADIPDIMLYNQHDIIQHSTKFNPSILVNKAGLINLSILG